MSHRSSIGGALDYRALARLHAPRDPARLAAEIHRLHSDQHLTARDIAGALGLDLSMVINVLSSNTRGNPRESFQP